MLISDAGTLVRTRVEEISIVGRNTQGVRLINLSEGEKLVGIQRIKEIEGQADSLEDSETEDTEGGLAENSLIETENSDSDLDSPVADDSANTSLDDSE